MPDDERRRQEEHKAVDTFSQAIKDTLDRPKNFAKGGWTESTKAYLLGLLDREVEELREAIEQGDAEHIASEAADVGACATMIFDMAGTEDKARAT